MGASDIDYASRVCSRFDVSPKLSRARSTRAYAKLYSLTRCRIFVPASLTKRPQQFTTRSCTRFLLARVRARVVSNRRGAKAEKPGGCNDSFI